MTKDKELRIKTEVAQTAAREIGKRLANLLMEQDSAANNFEKIRDFAVELQSSGLLPDREGDDKENIE